MEGFGGRVSVDQAIEWIDTHLKIADSEEILVDFVVGRVLAQPFVSPADAPITDFAVQDGYALRSAETVGASSYNPLVFCIQADLPTLMPFSAALVSSGTPLPQGADAVAPFDVVRVGTGIAELMGTVARGVGTVLRGQEARQGTQLIDTSRPLRPSDLGLISSFGIERVRVSRRPLVRLILAGRKPSGICELADSNGPMLRAHVLRDGGAIETCEYGINKRAAIAELIALPGADVVLVCGRTGTGPDDEAPLALGAAGNLFIHGIAMRPGGSTGMGSVGSIPVILLPGSPLDCLYAYDLFAGRLIRRLSGRCPQLPYRVRKTKVGRKIISSIGNVELCRVSLVAGEAIPFGAADSGGLASVGRADGFVFVPAPLEGYAPGTHVDVYMYDEAGDAEGIRI